MTVIPSLAGLRSRRALRTGLGALQSPGAGRLPPAPASALGSSACGAGSRTCRRPAERQKGLRHPSPRAPSCSGAHLAVAPAPRQRPVFPPLASVQPPRAVPGALLPHPRTLEQPSPGEQNGAVLQRAAAHRPPAFPDQLGFRALHALPGTRGAGLGPSGRGRRHRTCSAIPARTPVPPPGGAQQPLLPCGAKMPAARPRWRQLRRASPAAASADPARAAAPGAPLLREPPFKETAAPAPSRPARRALPLQPPGPGTT